MFEKNELRENQMNKDGEMNERSKSKLLYWVPILRILFGILFLFSAYTKLIDIPDFQKAIMKFAIIPDSYSSIASYVIPLLEFIIGIFIILNLYPMVTLRIALYLLTLFTSVILVKLFEGGNEISCGCFGALSSDKIDFITVLRNIILMIWVSIILYAYFQTKLVLTTEKKIKDRFISLLIIICFIFFIVSNSALAIRNIELKNRIYKLIEENVLTKGDKVGTFIAYKIDGAGESINYEKYSKSVIFIMKYGCENCKKNILIWNEIAKQFNSNEIRVIGVSVDERNITKKMIDEYKPKFEVAFNSTWEFNDNFKLFQTPVTVIIDRQGKILNIWKGLISMKLIPYLYQKLASN
jgi:peroxiredoxin